MQILTNSRNIEKFMCLERETPAGMELYIGDAAGDSGKIALRHVYPLRDDHSVVARLETATRYVEVVKPGNPRFVSAIPYEEQL